MRVDASLSGQQKTILYILQWYEFQNKLSLRRKSEIKALLEVKNFTENNAEYGRFYGMSEEEFEEFFRELDYSAMLALLASAEAAMKIDYLNRVDNRKPKGDLLKKYRVLYKDKGRKVSLEKDILEILKVTNDDLKDEISDFKGVFKLRHWLAHGRYEKPNLPRELRLYQVVDIYDVANNLLDGMDILGD